MLGSPGDQARPALAPSLQNPVVSGTGHRKEEQKEGKGSKLICFPKPHLCGDLGKIPVLDRLETRREKFLVGFSGEAAHSQSTRALAWAHRLSSTDFS